MRIFFTILIFLFTTSAFATDWCQWVDNEGANCQSDSRGYIVIDGIKTRTHSTRNAKGWYERIVTQPALGENQVKSLVQWSFANNEIGITWAVRDLTLIELDEAESHAMPLNTYYLWKTLIAKGTITIEEAVAALPQEIIDAYLARQRLEQ